MPDAGCRCHVHILDMYFSKLPPGAFDRDNIYLTPLPVAPKDPGKPWFFVSLVGRNNLSKIVKEICQEIKIPGNKTNHSLRVTGASEFFQAGVPENVTARNWSPVASVSAPVWTGHWWPTTSCMSGSKLYCQIDLWEWTSTPQHSTQGVVSCCGHSNLCTSDEFFFMYSEYLPKPSIAT